MTTERSQTDIAHSQVDDNVYQPKPNKTDKASADKTNIADTASMPKKSGKSGKAGKSSKVANASSKKTIRQNLSWYLQSIPLATRLVAIVLVFLFVASSILVLASRHLVSTALMQKTDTQLMRQATLVVNNVDLLQSEQNAQTGSLQTDKTDMSQTPTNQQNHPNVDQATLGQNAPNGQDPQGNANSAESQRPRPYSTTGNQNLGPTDYFVQVRDSENNILYTPLVPIARDGVEAIPKLPSGGVVPELGYNEPTTVESQVSLAQGVTLSDSNAITMAYSSWRVVAMKYMSRATGTPYIVYIALSLYDVNETIEALTRNFMWTAVGVFVAAGLIALIMIRRTLNSLKRMEKIAAKIAAGDLSQRIEETPRNTEIGSLSASLNTMLARIETSFKRQEEITNQMKRFVSDASHELRTPLAAIQGYAELYKMQRSYPQALDRADDAIGHIEKSSMRMSALVEDLLSLARLDEGRGINLGQTIAMTDVLKDSGEDLHALDPLRRITFGRLSLEAGSILTSSFTHELAQSVLRDQRNTSRLHDSNDTDDSESDSVTFDLFTFVPGELPDMKVGGDPVRMRQVITNIIGNIHRYTPTDSPVEIGAAVVRADLEVEDLSKLPATHETLMSFIEGINNSKNSTHAREYVVLRISDHGAGLHADAHEKIFERFYTVDPSRSREKGGTGLGMSIALSVVKAHHGLICAHETPGGGLTFTVVLPISQTVFFRSQDPADTPQDHASAPAIFGKRKRSHDAMTTTQIDVRLPQ